MDRSQETDRPVASRGRRGWSLGRRIRAEESYGILFVLIILSLTAMAAVADSWVGKGLTVALQGSVPLYAVWTTRSGRRALRTALLLVPGLVVLAAALSGGTSDVAEGIAAATSAALSLAAIGAIGRRVATHARVDAATILGALSIYLLIGMLFSALFLVVEAFSDQAFFGSAASSIDFVYFSFVTITTTGYGDLTAQTDVGRMLAVTEALLGQLYLVSVVAVVVANLGRERRAT